MKPLQNLESALDYNTLATSAALDALELTVRNLARARRHCLHLELTCVLLLIAAILGWAR